MTTIRTHKGEDWALTAEALERLLHCFDADRERAGERYEDLRRALVRYFVGRKILFAEECVDEVFNRVSRKLIDGVQISNIYGYCYEVARRVFLERQRSPESRMSSIEDIHLEYSAIDTLDDEIEKQRMLKFLDQCLGKLQPESRALIIGYYRHNQRDRTDWRKAMAERLHLSREALANRAQRLRDKLERCMASCLKKTAI